MTKISNQYSLTNILTADLANSRLGINNVSPAYSLDLTGTARVTTSAYFATASGSVGIGNTNGTVGALNVTGRIALTSSLFFSSNLTSEDRWEINVATPANDLYFSRSGVGERMRITSAGNVGIGTSTPSARLHTEVAVESPATSAVALLAKTSNGANDIFRWFDGATQLGVFKNNGNVGIGTSTPVYKFDIYDASLPLVALHNSTTTVDANRGFLMYMSGSDAYIQNKETSGILAFLTGGNSERMRITSGGFLLVGQTANNPIVSNTVGVRIGSESIFSNSSSEAVSIQRLNSTGTMVAFYYNPGSAYTPVGNISTNGTNTSYNTSSDYRLKEDLKDYNGLNIISKLKTYDFKWKNASIRDYGMMAHELQEVLPNYVNGVKDAINEDGRINPQAVDYSKIVPVLVKAIQELSAKVSLLENK